MKFLFDLLPVLLFFAMFKWGEGNRDQAQALAGEYLSNFVSGGVVTPEQAPILLATAVVIVATLIQIAIVLARGKKVDTMLWMSLAIIGVFGGATIYFHNETFIKWKPTVLYWSFATGLLVSQFFMKKNIIRTIMKDQVKLPDNVWSQLGLAWAVFFVAMGVLNLFIAFNFSTATWVNFKLFGGMGLMIAFIIGQSVFLSKYMKESG